MLGRIVEHVDVLVGNEEDLQKGLGMEGPQVEATSKLDPQRVRRHDRQRGEEVSPESRLSRPLCAKCIPRTRHTWSAVAWINGKTYNAPTSELDVIDRVGGGDGFASGFFYGLLAAKRRKKL